MKPQREFTNGFETPNLSVSSKTPTISLAPVEMSLPMHEQLHAPVQNAASARTIYPEQPSLALTSSIDARRKKLTDLPPGDEHVAAPVRNEYLTATQIRTSIERETSL